MTKLKTLHDQTSKELERTKACNELGAESELAAVISEARGRAGLTQQEVAQRMQTTQGNIARLEAGRTTPSTRTLEKFAEAVGSKLKISFEPVGTP